MKNVSLSWSRCIACALTTLTGVLALGASSAPACDTPVYRYAMYRWQPTPYEVYHFHDGKVDAAFTAIEQKLAAARDHEVSPANVEVFPVNLADDPDLKTVPRDVRQMWQKKEAQPPLTIVVNPLGFEVFAGTLEEAQVKALVQSPLRKQLGEQLEQGHAGVYVLISGKDEKLNDAAEKALSKLVADVNSGKLALYRVPDKYDPLTPQFTAPDDPAEPAGDTSDKPAADAAEDNPSNTQEKTAAQDNQSADEPPAHTVAMIKLSRDEAQSQDPWLLRCLMAVENDLGEFQDEPMMFVVYGRGRALPPYIGKGITYDNLVEVTDFITSACSCTVKDQNPGVDLLMAYDWESASAAIAEKFGAEEGNEESLTDLFPQLIIPGTVDDPPAVADAGEPADKPAGDDTTTNEDAATTGDDAPDVDSNNDGQAATNDAATTATDTDEPAPAEDASEGGSDDEETSLAAVNASLPGRQATEAQPEPAATGNLMATLGIGLGVAFLALLAATFFVLKPQ